MSRIKALSVRNFKRINDIEIEPGGRQIVILGGRNAQGKSSVLDSITTALAGAKAIPSEPVKAGEDKGEVTITLSDDTTIKRTFTRKDDGTFGGSLTVKSADGMSPRGTQGWLDARIGAMTCDPMAFLSLDDKKQADKLREIAGVDTTEIDRRRAVVYDERRDLGRDGATAKGALESMAHYPDAPDAAPEPVIIPASDILAEIDAATTTARTAEDAKRRSEDAARFAEQARDKSRTAAATVARLVEDLRLARLAAADAEASVTTTEAAASDALTAAQAAAANVIDAAPIRGRLSSLEATNKAARDEAAKVAAKVAANKARAAKAAEVERLRAAYQAKTDAIAHLDADRAAMIAAAKMPVDGLSFNSDGAVTFGGVPLAQASGAEKIRVSMGIALAGAPDDGIRIVLIRDASLLDDDSLSLVAAAAAELDAQVWLERVGNRDDGAIIIEDGGVIGGAQ